MFDHSSAPESGDQASNRKYFLRSQTARRIAFVVSLVLIIMIGVNRRRAWEREMSDTGIGGDALTFFSIADSIGHGHGVSVDGKTPEYTRVPGFPFFLWATVHRKVWDDKLPFGLESTMRYLRSVRRVQVRVDLGCAIALVLIALGLGAKRYALLGAIIWAIQPWSSLVAFHPLSDPLATFTTALTLAALVRYVDTKAIGWLIATACGVALAMWVRFDGILLLPLAIGAPLLAEETWRKRISHATIAFLVAATCYSPWPIRNIRLFGKPHILVSGSGPKAEPIDRSLEFRWSRTFDINEPTIRYLLWAIPGHRLKMELLPQNATDSNEERTEIASIFEAYNRNHFQMTDELRARLLAVTVEREHRHPIHCFLIRPLQRAYQVLVGQRDGYGMGTVKDLVKHKTAFKVLNHLVVWGGFLTLLVLGLSGRRAIAALLALYLFTRIAVVDLVLPEPRYVLQSLPLLVALLATLPALCIELWRRRRST